MVKLNWTEIAVNDLKDIHDYIAKSSKRYAHITVSKIYTKSQLIICNPNIGRIVPEINNKLIRELILGNYRIIYRIVNKYQVDILRIYHSARLLSKNKL